MKLTVQDAAKMLNVSEREVYRWIRDEKLPVHRVNDNLRFHPTELLEWATSRGVRVSAEGFEALAGNGARKPSLSAALARGGVHHHVGGSDRESVLRAVVQLMPIEDEDRDLLFDFLRAREALGSTGIGEGIAIPHVRNPVVLHVAEPSVTLCFLESSVDFDAIDGRPVTILFSLVSGTIRSHLHLLSRLSAALHDPKFKEAVLRRAPAEEILAEARRVEEELASKVGLEERAKP